MPGFPQRRLEVEMALASWMLAADGPQLNEQSVVVAGHKMRCLMTGSGPNVVLLHGLLGAAESWYPCFSRLGEISKIYAVDALGIGRSERVPGIDASLCAQVDRLAQFMQGAGIGQADIVGTSHGGAVAMMLASRHPHMVRSLVLHAPANPFSTMADPLVHFYCSPLGHWFARRVPNLPEKLQELALGRMYGDARLLQRRVLDRHLSSLRVPGTINHVLHILEHWFDDMRELEKVLGNLQDVPIHLLWGTRDRAVSIESGRLLQKIFKNAEMSVLQGIGHMPYEESPIPFSEAINVFLSQLDRGATRKGPHLVRTTYPAQKSV
jgi:pimeloyl-ACP methyl ester carboxylesterase